jgi:hypothetical protein
MFLRNVSVGSFTAVTFVVPWVTILPLGYFHHGPI